MNFSIGLAEAWLLMPMIVVFLTSLIPITAKVLSGNTERPDIITMSIGVIGCFLAGVLVLVNWLSDSREAFQGALVFDGVSSWSAVVILFITATSLVFAYSNASTKGDQFSEHVFLMLNAAIGMLTLVWANDLIIVFVGMEIMSLCLYLLIGMSHEQKLSKEAAFKYFILGSIGSAMFLFGVALMYGGAASTSLTVLIEQGPGLFASNRMFLFGGLMVLSGIGFKVSLFPFHVWTPDVYEGSPTSITGFMATGVKLAMFVVFLRFMATKGVAGVSATLVALQWIAVLTMFIGNLAALRQANFKRMLAYSSIAHSGYLMVGLIATGVSAQASLQASSVVFYLITYAIMNLGAFGLISMLEKNEDVRIGVDDLKGLAKRRPGLALALTIILLSLAGIPPTAGFFGKFYLFSAAATEGLFWLAVWGVINSVISVYYYLKPVVNMYMFESNEPALEPSRNFLGRLAVATMAVLVVVIGLASSPLYRALAISVRSMFGV